MRWPRGSKTFNNNFLRAQDDSNVSTFAAKKSPCVPIF